MLDVDYMLLSSPICCRKLYTDESKLLLICILWTMLVALRAFANF